MLQRRLVLGSALALAGVGRGARAQSGQAGPIRIGCVGPMTGQYAAFGTQMKAGSEQAVADLNAKGGVMGRQIALEIGDDACDPRQAVSVANQIAGRGVRFVDNACFPGGKGRELTADDVLYSLKRYADANVNSKSFFAMQGAVVGLDEFRAATAKAGPGVDV